jgi:ribosomal protein S18 acetylase RimI-like enzyme
VVSGHVVRPVTSGDRADIERMFLANAIFGPHEVAVALEVFDTSLNPGQGDYESRGIELDGRVVGWICWGPTPCTEGTFDMYWIAVDPSVHGAGLGSRLVAEMEHRLAGRARLIVVETGGRTAYGATRAFYLARNYEEVARVPDFYAPGDDQVIFVKRLSPHDPPSETTPPGSS